MSVYAEIAERVSQAAERRQPLRVVGGNSKAFYGRPIDFPLLPMADVTGTVSYEPSELVATVRAGTRLAEFGALLAAEGQGLACEPPQFADAATVGGAVAAGLSGPTRPFSGALRDSVLGVTCINGRGELLRFGGQVMKNVAGFDVSRLLVGSLGTLAIIVEVSLKVLPLPEAQTTRVLMVDAERAIELMNELAGRSLPLVSCAYHAGALYLRLAGTEAGIDSAGATIGGDANAPDDFWPALRDHRLGFFHNDLPLWRLIVPSNVPPLDVAGEWLIDWAGGQRWLLSDADATEVRAAAARVGGSAECFRGSDGSAQLAPLSRPLLALHRRLKDSFDPAGILNPGRMYASL